MQHTQKLPSAPSPPIYVEEDLVAMDTTLTSRGDREQKKGSKRAIIDNMFGSFL